MTIPRRTRKNILDWLRVERVSWSGRLDGIDFLDRIYDLSDLPSDDYRYPDARGDIYQHTVNNDDWDIDWVYDDQRFGLLNGPEEDFLLFLCEMIHPVVRPNMDEARRLAGEFNSLLQADGYELFESTAIGGHPVFAARRRDLKGAQALVGVKHARAAFNEDYISQQITRMEASIESDPDLAVGTSKELVETTAKAILAARGRQPDKRSDLPKLVRDVGDELGLVPEGISNETKAADTVRRVLGSLSTLVSGIDDLRNLYGTGHGRLPARGVQPRHAKLVVGAASTLAVFLWETHLERPLDKSRGSGG